MDDATRARLENNLRHEMPYGNTTVLCGDVRALLAAYDALLAAQAQAAPVLAALEKWVNYAHHEELLDAVATWRAAREG